MEAWLHEAMEWIRTHSPEIIIGLLVLLGLALEKIGRQLTLIYDVLIDILEKKKSK
jgi:hypothetical protein